MKQLEVIEMFEILTKEGSINYGSKHLKDEALCFLSSLKGILKEYYELYIKAALQDPKCLSLEELEYESWYEVFLKCDGEEYASYAKELFTEEQLEEIWQAAHKDGGDEDER